MVNLSNGISQGINLASELTNKSGLLTYSLYKPNPDTGKVEKLTKTISLNVVTNINHNLSQSITTQATDLVQDDGGRVATENTYSEPITANISFVVTEGSSIFEGWSSFVSGIKSSLVNLINVGTGDVYNSNSTQVKVLNFLKDAKRNATRFTVQTHLFIIDNMVIESVVSRVSTVYKKNAMEISISFRENKNFQFNLSPSNAKYASLDNSKIGTTDISLDDFIERSKDNIVRRFS